MIASSRHFPSELTRSQSVSQLKSLWPGLGWKRKNGSIIGQTGRLLIVRLSFSSSRWRRVDYVRRDGWEWEMTPRKVRKLYEPRNEGWNRPGNVEVDKCMRFLTHLSLEGNEGSKGRWKTKLARPNHTFQIDVYLHWNNSGNRFIKEFSRNS